VEESEKGLATLMAEKTQIETLFEEQKQTLVKTRADLDSNKAKKTSFRTA
jgi:hypothetical protein